MHGHDCCTIEPALEAGFEFAFQALVLFVGEIVVARGVDAGVFFCAREPPFPASGTYSVSGFGVAVVGEDITRQEHRVGWTLQTFRPIWGHLWLRNILHGLRIRANCEHRKHRLWVSSFNSLRDASRRGLGMVDLNFGGSD